MKLLQKFSAFFLSIFWQNFSNNFHLHHSNTFFTPNEIFSTFSVWSANFIWRRPTRWCCSSRSSDQSSVVVRLLRQVNKLYWISISWPCLSNVKASKSVMIHCSGRRNFDLMFGTNNFKAEQTVQMPSVSLPWWYWYYSGPHPTNINGKKAILVNAFDGLISIDLLH